MENIKLIASTTMGLESIVTRELKELNYKNIETFNGRVEFNGSINDIIKTNLWLRCADRIFLKMGEFKAESFEELFQKTKKIKWEDLIPIDGNFQVSWISSVKSKLFSKRDCQSIIKKAIVDRLKFKHKTETLTETGSVYKIKVQINKDIVLLSVDTSGEPLHKRGYRIKNNEAPIKETLAAALIYLTNWRGDRTIIDPTCGTGTIAIEAALMAKNMAPGAERSFVSEKWNIIQKESWIEERDKCYSLEKEAKCKIYASDIDVDTIEIAKKNAYNANVDDIIEFEVKDLKSIRNYNRDEKGLLISNPPYGIRLQEAKEAEKLYENLGKVCRTLFSDWNCFIITSSENFEKKFGRKADKNRKLYNGGLKCYYYQYFPKRNNR